MGLLGKTHAEARVALYNLKRFDAGSGDPVLAAVDAPGPDEHFGERPVIALILPLTAVVLLRNSARQQAVASPMMELVRLAAAQMLEGPEEARALRLREQVEMDPLQALDRDPEYAAAGIIGIGLPELYEDARGRPDKTFKAQLRTGRGGLPFGAVRGVGNAFQALFGWFPLLEWTAREMPYGDVVEPVGRALTRLTEIYFDDLDERVPSFAESNVLGVTMLETLGAT